jgi:hypothetical protein
LNSKFKTHEAHLEDLKAKEGHLEEGEAAKPKKGQRKAQNQTQKFPLNQTPFNTLNVISPLR